MAGFFQGYDLLVTGSDDLGLPDGWLHGLGGRSSSVVAGCASVSCCPSLTMPHRSASPEPSKAASSSSSSSSSSHSVREPRPPTPPPSSSFGWNCPMERLFLLRN
eukprot:COSAG01_NODE_5519_length_4206_cov_8.464703_5_plen_105_part_00